MERKYSCKADLDFEVEGVPSYKLEYPNSVRVDYTVVFDEAEWGIKDYYVNFDAPLSFSYRLEGRSYDVTVSIADMEKADIMYWHIPPLAVNFVSVKMRSFGDYSVHVDVGDIP